MLIFVGEPTGRPYLVVLPPVVLPGFPAVAFAFGDRFGFGFAVVFGLAAGFALAVAPVFFGDCFAVVFVPVVFAPVFFGAGFFVPACFVAILVAPVICRVSSSMIRHSLAPGKEQLR